MARIAWLESIAPRNPSAALALARERAALVEATRVRERREDQQFAIDHRPPRAPTIVPPGGTMVGPDGRPVFTAPPAPRSDGFEVNPAGGLRFIQGGPADPAVLAARSESTRRATPMPSHVQTAEGEDLTAMGTATGINQDLARMTAQIDDGTLNLGFIANNLNRAGNFVGLDSVQSRNLTSFEATLERMRNESLRLNSGVQTGGDAKRAWSELVTNLNNPGVVRQRLAEIAGLNERAVALREGLIQQRRSNYGLPELDTSRFRNPAPPGQAGTQRPMSEAEYRAAPSGTPFTAPDGSQRIKP